MNVATNLHREEIVVERLYLIICTWLDENVLKKFYISVVESQAANINILITVDSYI